MMLIQNPNALQLLKEKATGKKFKLDPQSLSRVDRVAFLVRLAEKKANRVIKRKDDLLYDIGDLRKRYRSIEETFDMPKEKQRNVMKTVDTVSK